jgi:hypothetical protein
MLTICQNTDLITDFGVEMTDDKPDVVPRWELYGKHYQCDPYRAI